MPIQFDFSGKGVFVTDSATGLGRRIAEAFHELGATVAIHDASPVQVENAVRELGGGSRLIAAPGTSRRPPRWRPSSRKQSVTSVDLTCSFAAPRRGVFAPSTGLAKRTSDE